MYFNIRVVSLNLYSTRTRSRYYIHNGGATNCAKNATIIIYIIIIKI